MKNFELLTKIESTIDDAVKYVFLVEESNILEVTYINKHDGKVILCMPSQTGCKLGCKFCFLTDIKDEIKVRNVDPLEYDYMVDYIVNDMNMQFSDDNQLLLSFMGSGEPLNNIYNIMTYMIVCKDKYIYVRGAIATIIPSYTRFKMLEHSAKEHNIDMKVHLSLHYTDDATRRQWMPAAGDIEMSMKLLRDYEGRKEIHYTLIEGVNDTDDNIDKLIKMTEGIKGLTVKFLKFNPKDSKDVKGSSDKRINEICSKLDKAGIINETYLPPAGDIGGSCGQFLLKYYKKYNCAQEVK